LETLVFERRLKALVWVLGVMLLIMVLRLGQLQIVQGSYYRQRAERSFRFAPRQIPFVRGSILDRTGEVLVADEPCWDLAVDYGVIAAAVGDGPAAIKAQVQRWKRRGRYPQAETDEEVERAFRDDLEAMWACMARFAGEGQPISTDELRDRARGIYEQIVRIRRAVADRRGFDAPVAEETEAHALISGLDSDRQIAARELFAGYPWAHVEPSSTRSFVGDAAPFAHVLGRLGKVNATDIADDPNADDPFAKYRADERLGITGVEWAAQRILRGRRGQITEDRDGSLVDEGYIAPADGSDIRLTLHAGLQRRLYRLLGAAVEGIPESSGGAIVVLDVARRDVLALVSYPSYDPTRFNELYPLLRDDTNRLPLRFRAVANRYVPGSTIKPLVCLSGLMRGKITLDDRELCTGYLFDDVRDRWRCWQIHGTNQRKAHGAVDVVEALTGSCNVFMYRLAEKLGVDGLCSAFDMVGIGSYSGIGLREEVKGINPTPSWLMTYRNTRATPGTARLFGIGQGELAMTPVQVANLMATYASGRYRHVTLIKRDTPTPEWIIPATSEQWMAVRRGIYGVINDPTGTAYHFARFEHDRWVLCGKTGSATAHPWPTSYRIPYTDDNGAERVALVRAGSKRTAVERFAAEYRKATFNPAGAEVATRWPRDPPPPGHKHSHAWVAAYLQARDAAGQPDWSQPPRVAFSVLVEYGGSGGRTSGPLAKAVAAELLDVFGPDLNLDPPGVTYPFRTAPVGKRPGEFRKSVGRGRSLTVPVRTERRPYQ
jgi:cell division protein FtsI/penicillin-binding protein 2